MQRDGGKFSLGVIAAPVKKGTKKHGKVHRQGKRKEARYP
jgi:hypothetical protein